MLTPSSGNVGLQWSCNRSSAGVGENLTHLGAESQDHLVHETAFSAQLQNSRLTFTSWVAQEGAL